MGIPEYGLHSAAATARGEQDCQPDCQPAPWPPRPSGKEAWDSARSLSFDDTLLPSQWQQRQTCIRTCIRTSGALEHFFCYRILGTPTWKIRLKRAGKARTKKNGQRMRMETNRTCVFLAVIEEAFGTLGHTNTTPSNNHCHARHKRARIKTLVYLHGTPMPASQAGRYGREGVAEQLSSQVRMARLLRPGPTPNESKIEHICQNLDAQSHPTPSAHSSSMTSATSSPPGKPSPTSTSAPATSEATGTLTPASSSTQALI